jgi:two-component system sensor histidine kinase ChiS
MIMYHLSVFLLQRRYSYRAELYFVWLMVLFVLRVVCGGEYLILGIVPSTAVNWLVFVEYATVYWAPAALSLFMRELFPEECDPRAANGIIAVSGLLTLITLATPIGFYTRYTLFIQCLLVLLTLYYVWAAWLAAVRRRIGAALLFSTIIFSIGAFVLEALYHWNRYNSKYEGVFPVVSFVYIFVQSFILAQRSSAAFAEVETLSQKLIAFDKLKDEFVANTSHELRTPLHGMINITESVLQSAATGLSARDQENLSLVVASGKRLANLINDILDYEKLKYGDIKLNRRKTDLGQVVARVLEVSQYLTAAKPIALTSRIPRNLPAIDADEDRLTQIIYNLVGNAAKFTESGTITVAAVRKDDMVEISVADTGIGIPADKLDTIFKSFEQLDTSLSGQAGGTGLGLSISKYLVESHGGTIRVQSAPGKGSTFTFSMPVSNTVPLRSEPIRDRELEVDYTPRDSFAAKAAALSPSNSDFTVLLVDDDYVNLRALSNIVAAENYGAIAVSGGPAALEALARNKHIDLVILDVMLPEMSGYEVCRQIRKEYSLSELPVLLMTAQNSAASLLTGFAAGANDFLSKPFDSSELKARMKTLLHLKRSVNQAIQAELAFLQAQIKPHFLYNALNTIIAFCWTDPEKAGHLLLSLSDYLRGSINFNSTEQFIPLQQELELVQSYLTIEKARFEEKLNCRYLLDVTPDVLVPTLILQPIVENAVKHGILPKEDGGTVTISIQPDDPYIRITIEDDGIGIPPEKLSRLLEAPSDQSVGLTNINRRLKRLYGYGLAISSRINGGTTVNIKIPVQRKE